MARQPRVRPPKPVVTEIERSPVQVLIGTEADDNLYDQFAFLRTVNTVSDRFVGGAGNDTITSFGGGDFIDAGAGNDRIDASGGTVFIDGGTGIDRAYVTFENTSVGLTVTGNIGSGRTATFSDGTTITNIENLALQLGSGADNITLGAGATIYGGAGNDRLKLTGSGSIDGGSNNDRIIGSAGDDGLGGGEGDDDIRGNGGNDFLLGGSGIDFLDGGDGDDRLEGGSGVDALVGGAGADLFFISAATQGDDRVLDFNFAAGDRIDAFFQIFPPNFDSAFPETATLVTDPVGQGFLTLTQGSTGVFVGLTADPSSGLLLVGTVLADVTSEWFI